MVVGEELSPRAKAGFPRVPSLDGLRGLAIILILISHGRFCANFPNLSWITFDGSAGVAFFFITTGFLITTLILDEKEKYGRIRLKAFYVRRLVRLWPALYAYLGVVAILAWMGWIPLDWQAWTNSALHIYNFSNHTSWVVHHVWSLSLQEQFYIVWPVVIAFTRQRVMAWMAVGVILLWPVARFVRHGYFYRDDVRAALDAPAMSTILFGVLMAVWYRSKADLPFIRRLARGWPGLILPPLGIWAIYGVADHLPHGFAPFIGPARSLLVLWWVWWCISNPESPFGRFLENRVLKSLGAVAFSIYIWQQLFLGLNTGWLTFFPQNLVATMICAYASYYLLEMPVNRLKVFDWARRNPLKRADSAATTLQPSPVQDR